MSRPDPLLEVRDLNVAYGGIQAVKGIDLVVGAGEMVCLIGANGAGKTSTLKAIAGLLPVTRASVRFAGEPVGGLRAFQLVRRGLALVPEGRGVFPQLTVDENLAMGAYIRSDREAIAADRAQLFERFPRLQERRSQSAGTLSGGEQQMLAIARQGVTVLVVEQNARLALEACHYGYVLESGTIRLHDAAPALAANDAVRRAYLGE
jgi:branched-chain amino acid transport system ATP-binding protein